MTAPAANSTRIAKRFAALAPRRGTRHRGVHYGGRSFARRDAEIRSRACRSGRRRHRAGHSVQRSACRRADDSARFRTRTESRRNAGGRARPGRRIRKIPQPRKFRSFFSATSTRSSRWASKNSPPPHPSPAPTACLPPISRPKNPSNIAAFSPPHNLDTVFLAAPTSPTSASK